MKIVFNFDDLPAITPHQAHGLEHLLSAIGTQEATAVASKLADGYESTDERFVVDLTDRDKRTLLSALDDVDSDEAPKELARLRRELAALFMDRHDERSPGDRPGESASN